MTAIALTIAGSDSSGGAGIQADLKTFSALGVYGASVITALTAQNTQGVDGVHEVPACFVGQQLTSVFNDLSIGAVKIGMLANKEIIDVVADKLSFFQPAFIILDPVMIATSGDALLKQGACDALVSKLFPFATVITPNLHEAAFLTKRAKAQNEREMALQAQALFQMGAKNILLKGGHSLGEEARDLFYDGEQKIWLRSKRYKTKNTHGTGCTLSSAIAAELAKDIAMKQALQNSKRYMSGAIASADSLTIGKGYGPIHHFFQLW